MKRREWLVVTLTVAIVSMAILAYAFGQPPAESGTGTPQVVPSPVTTGAGSLSWKDLVAWIPAFALLVTLLTFAWQISAQRAAARYNVQLTRLNKQLSDLYGPLYALYEAGERNWLQFLCEYSSDKRPLNVRKFLPDPDDSFTPPGTEAIAEYRKRMERLFMPTNRALAKAINEHADLIVGNTMPEELSSFLAHVAAADLLIDRWSTYDQTQKDDFNEHRVRYPHPVELKNYLRAAFKVLKEEQQAMLVNPKWVLNEKQLATQIEARKVQEAEAWRIQGPSYSGMLGERGA